MLCWVVAGAGAVGTGDQDELRLGCGCVCFCTLLQDHALCGVKYAISCMLVSERRELLLSRLRADGKLIARDLAVELGISEDSVRRDLRDLAAAGLCQRVYGGAVPVSRALADYGMRASVEPESKRLVASHAVDLIRARASGDPRRRHDHARRRPGAAPGSSGDGDHPQPDDRGRPGRRTRPSRSCCSAAASTSIQPWPAVRPRSRRRRP